MELLQKNKKKKEPLMIPFIDLKAQQKLIRNKVEDRFQAILDHGAYIMGPEVFELEKKLAEFCGAKHALTCSSGTDALSLILMAKGVKAGDAVMVPAFTFTATAEVVALVGATPIFVDVCDDTFNMCTQSLEAGIATAKGQGLNPVGVIAVDLFGQPADYDAIEMVCNDNELWLLSDAAQSFGAQYKGRKVGTIGDATATSFFPAKPLGCYGDGGAVFTDNDELAALMHSIRVHGQGTDKYDNPRIGLNARMDTMQAAVLLEKLEIFQDELAARQKVADRYNDALSNIAMTPYVMDDVTSSWAQYTLCLNTENREEVQSALKEAGVPTAVYYPIPLNKQTGYKHYPSATAELENSEKLSKVVISLPMHPYLDEETQDTIIKVLQDFLINEISKAA
jgi:dTDP-4-amino-4,6-dideoxygalactose transaminase